jgi:pimeloyl-ACP methyl ester carboxylesterase
MTEITEPWTRGRWRRRVLWILGVGIVAYAALVWVASSRFIHVRGLLPRKDVGVAGLSDITATTDDGLTLRGSFVEPADAKGVVVVFHGVGCERSRGALPVIASWGLVGVSFDFRGHGASDGDVTTYGWEERRDVAAAITAVRARWPGRKVAGWGVSLGGAALCYAADVTRDLDAVVLESAYRDIDSAFERRVTTTSSRLLVPLAIPAKWLVAARLGLDPDRLRPCDYTCRLRPERTLIVTGDKDVWAGPGDLEALAGPCPGCTTYLVVGAGHNDVWKVGGDAYLRYVRDFVLPRMR